MVGLQSSNLNRKGKDMKRVFVIGLCFILLFGCARSDSTEQDNYLLEACGSFEEFKATSDYSLRILSIAKTSTYFRQAAFVSSDVKYEILAEYAETPLDSLGNLQAHRQEIEDFCARLVGNEPTD